MKDLRLEQQQVEQDGYDHISEGVRDLVRELNEAGFETTDSGDGSNYENGMECALPYRHVFGKIPEGADLVEFANDLQFRYPKARVEVNYAPGEPAMFLLFPDGPPY